MENLPNAARNTEVAEAIERLKQADGGALSHKPSGVAGALSSLNVAESLQLLQLQLVETSKENRVALHSAIDELIKSNTELAISNDNHARAMKWLTAALVLVGVAQVIVALFR